jgi:hypothetical protein
MRHSFGLTGLRALHAAVNFRQPCGTQRCIVCIHAFDQAGRQPGPLLQRKAQRGIEKCIKSHRIHARIHAAKPAESQVPLRLLPTQFRHGNILPEFPHQLFSKRMRRWTRKSPRAGASRGGLPGDPARPDPARTVADYRPIRAASGSLGAVLGASRAASGSLGAVFGALRAASGSLRAADGAWRARSGFWILAIENSGLYEGARVCFTGHRGSED